MLVVLYRSPTSDASALIEKLSAKRGLVQGCGARHPCDYIRGDDPVLQSNADRIGGNPRHYNPTVNCD
jgi:hypothetical protein